MALVAMFAFSTAADAQFGLLKAAKKAVSKKEKVTVVNPTTGETETKTLKSAEVQVRNWKTGEMVVVENPYQKDPDNKPFTADQLWNKEKNWQDVDSKKQIIQSILSDEKFNNRKRAADDIEKDRKLVAVIFACNDWTVQYYNDGTINKREVELYTVHELSNGLTRAQLCYYSQKYTGGGEYSKALTLREGGIDLVKDWEHKDDADPLADL